MNEKELYHQKKQAKLDEWKAELDKLKAKASGANADAKLKLNKEIKALDSKMEAAKAKLSEIADANKDEWESIKNNIESTWDVTKSAFSEAVAKFKK